VADKVVSLAQTAGGAKAKSEDLHQFLSPIEEIVEDMRAGKMVILVDDENRENEGDLIVAAEKATPDVINFMARFGRGLVCLSMTRSRVEALGLPMMTRENRSGHGTAFTISIEAREGVTTGISAYDRSHTIATAIDPNKGRDDIVSPGHVFPLVAKDGGVLVRAGHTEASVDLARLAGLNPSGVICEIMNEDGTMARLPDLVKFAQFHGLKVATIADLIAYRMSKDAIVERVLETRLVRKQGGDFRMIVYVNKISGAEHVALVKGDISGPAPVLVRMHALNILDDLLLDQASPRSGELEASLRIIGAEGRGVLVLIREPRVQYFSAQVRDRHPLAEPAGQDTQAGLTVLPLRDYGVGAQILADLGVHEMILLTNTTRQVPGLEGYGLKLVERRPFKPMEY
jgi:3,4-dihydroxy 2-butanone 4-phosphate synthase/GTP cyclohydrolase II